MHPVNLPPPPVLFQMPGQDAPLALGYKVCINKYHALSSNKQKKCKYQSERKAPKYSLALALPMHPRIPPRPGPPPDSPTIIPPSFLETIHLTKQNFNNMNDWNVTVLSFRPAKEECLMAWLKVSIGVLLSPAIPAPLSQSTYRLVPLYVCHKQ